MIFATRNALIGMKVMINKISIISMSHEEWLLERRGSLGGSDIGAVLGLNRYATPYTVWAEKTGRLPEKEDNEAMRQGRDLEEYVAKRFSEKSGKRVNRYNYLLRNSDAPYLHANIDRRVVGEKAGLECKTASALSIKSYSGGEFPESYYAQCVAYLAVTGWDRWYLAALVLNKAFYVYQITTIPDDPVPDWCESSIYAGPEELETLKRCAAEFWERYVLTDNPPSPDGLPPTGEAISSIFCWDAYGTMELFGRDQMLEEYFRMSSEKKELQRQIDSIKQTIQLDMGDCTEAICGGAKITWRSHKRNSFDMKAFQKANPDILLSPFYRQTESRVFKITKKED